MHSSLHSGYTSIILTVITRIPQNQIKISSHKESIVKHEIARLTRLLLLSLFEKHHFLEGLNFAIFLIICRYRIILIN